MKLQIIDPKYIIPVTTFCLYIYGHKYVILILYLLYSNISLKDFLKIGVMAGSPSQE